MTTKTKMSERKNNAEAKLNLIRSIVVSASIKAGENLSPGASSAIAWRTISDISRILMPPDVAPDEIKEHNLIKS